MNLTKTQVAELHLAQALGYTDLHLNEVSKLLVGYTADRTGADKNGFLNVVPGWASDLGQALALSIQHKIDIEYIGERGAHFTYNVPTDKNERGVKGFRANSIFLPFAGYESQKQAVCCGVVEAAALQLKAAKEYEEQKQKEEQQCQLSITENQS